MSDNMFAIAVTVGTFVFLTMWVPFLDSCAAVLHGMSAKAKTLKEADVRVYGSAIAGE